MLKRVRVCACAHIWSAFQPSCPRCRPWCSASKLVPPKPVAIKVDGLHTVDRRDALIKSLIAVKGVTSVTVDLRKGAVIAYTYKNVDDLKTDMLEAIRVVDAATRTQVP